MKITQQTPNTLSLRYLPIYEWLNSLTCLIISILGLINQSRIPLLGLLWLLLLVISIFLLLAWGKIIDCVASKSSETVKVTQRNLLGVKVHKYQFQEIFQVEVTEKRFKNGKYYRVYLLFPSGERLFLSQRSQFVGFNQRQQIEEKARLLAEFINCSYAFMPASSWNFFGF